MPSDHIRKVQGQTVFEEEAQWVTIVNRTWAYVALKTV